MISVNNVCALHQFNQSLENNFKTRFFGDLIQYVIIFFFNILIFQLKDLLNDKVKIEGILKFRKFYFKPLKHFNF